MRTIAWIKTGERDREVAERARSHGLELSALSDFTIQHSRPDALVLGFAGCAIAELQRGADVLASVLENRQAYGTPQFGGRDLTRLSTPKP